ncbi:alpha,alpha-phosphotrehalase [Companilactobacillus kimchii]|uniref:Trehalose-6-phosphate phosphoglucohydrolase (Phosphotrehalase) n=2 Tax=Companilactobacillus kimchii TaxID=2801452 RepID=A0ABR5NUT1_9LACO|nr:alpha,alpha-phosphotrehalase [Companilactobacillus kimchii]KRK52545.1 trehalose-6-phosphate phosphoglucohydrolase (phosphotrehalase) [Companilactobacillus kimchii DSM 13961 = JCM 10707]OWF32664.1 Alpha,alpha-phosphotrehalase [Companilactobacillus kimchii]GEO48526.1 alpha-glucosidase [Companilactobacillus paralimentarius]
MKEWQKETVYQIYPRSFQDSNGDGIGDINGIISRLDYLQKLGIGLIWLTPMYLSPGNDNGYDIADYYKIDPVFGTMDDFEKLLSEAHKRDIKIIMDMVLNHTSNENPWFKEALKSKDNPYHNYYIWRDPVDGHEPNNWVSKFSGSAWKYVPELDQYYLHLYDVTMPDLNWRNENLRAEIFKMLTYWANKGIDGFRLDVINNISKDKNMPNDTFDTPLDDGRNFYTNGPHVHEYIHEMYEKVFGPNKFVTVGELSSTPISEAVKYTNPKRQELSMAFTFHHVKVDYTNGKKWTLGHYKLTDLTSILSAWQTQMQRHGGWNALFWNNHDQPRAISRFTNDDEYRDQSAKLLAMVEFGLQGTPYIYQGDEIAMKNAYFTDIKQYKDHESINAYHAMLKNGMSEDLALQILQQKSRENSRLPMQWDSTKYYGFTTGQPWLKPQHHDDYSVEKVLKTKNNIFDFYRALIFLRKHKTVLVDGEYKLLNPKDNSVYSYERFNNKRKILVMANFTEQAQERDVAAGFDLILGNYGDMQLNRGKITLRPYESVMLEKK